MSLENELELELKQFGDEIRRLLELNRIDPSSASRMGRVPDDDESSDTDRPGSRQIEAMTFIRRLLDQEYTHSRAGSAETQELQRICGQWIVMQQWKLDLANETIAKRAGIPVEIIQLLQSGLADESLAHEDRWSLLAALLVDDTHDYDRVEAIVYVALGNQTFADRQTIAMVTQELTNDDRHNYEAVRAVMALLTDKPASHLDTLPPIAFAYLVTGFMSQVFIQFTPTLTKAMQQPEPAGKFRSAAPTAEPDSYQESQVPPQEYTCQFRGSAPDELTVKIDFTLADAERQLYSMRLAVIDQDPDPFSQDGHEVAIFYEGLEKESPTDPNGYATFRDIPYPALPQLQVIINLRSST